MRIGRADILRSRDGTAAIEFAIIVPVLLVMIAAIVEFGSLFTVYNQSYRLAAQYAVAWSDCSDDTATTCVNELSAYTAASAIKNIAPQLDAASLTLQMIQVQMSGGTPKVVYASSGATLGANQISAAQAAFADKQIGVIVSVAYQHSLKYFPTQMTAIIPASVLAVSYTVTQLKR